MKRPASRPKLGDPVVVAGVKYRIREFYAGRITARVVQSFGGRARDVRLADLEWDKVAGVWRA